MKLMQSLADSVFECVEREFQFSGSWEACSNLETVTKLKTSECGILSILTKQNLKNAYIPFYFQSKLCFPLSYAQL